MKTLIIFLGILGGLFYLLQKIFLSVAERVERKKPKNKSWRTWAWRVYLAGLPPWIIIFCFERNWIAAALEAAGLPAMILGLVKAAQGINGEKDPKWLKNTARLVIVVGLVYSLYDFGGLNTVNQYLELGMVIGFLIGTYQLAEKRAAGYLWYIPMCACNAVLMWIEHHPWLFVQQIVSLVFILDAYFANKRKLSLQTA